MVTGFQTIGRSERKKTMETTTNNTTLRQRYDAWETMTNNWVMTERGWFIQTSPTTLVAVSTTEQDAAYDELKNIFSAIDAGLAFDLALTWFIHGWSLDLPHDTWANEKWDMLVSQMGN